MSQLLFFPWYVTLEARRVGEFELLPFASGQRPFTGETQQHIDRILGCYQNASGRPINRATLLQVGAHGVLDDLTAHEQDSASEFALLLCGSALAERTYFQQFGYTNADSFVLIRQHFDGTPDVIAPRTRRRDGSNSDIWPLDKYRVIKPPHVQPGLRPGVDWALLESLLEARRERDFEVYSDALVGFNLANTDSDRIPTHSELVLLVGALQRLLNCASAREHDLVAAIRQLLRPTQSIRPTARARIARDEASQERHARDVTLREAWVKDLYRSRGNAAHGKLTHAYKSAWSIEEHLLLGAFLFPRILKQRLADDGRYSMTSRDLRDIDTFEALAAADHFVGARDGEWPWTRILDSDRR